MHEASNKRSDLEKGFQLSKVEVGVEAGGLVPDSALLGGLDLVPVQLLQLAPLACCRPHLHDSSLHFLFSVLFCFGFLTGIDAKGTTKVLLRKLHKPPACACGLLFWHTPSHALSSPASPVLSVCVCSTGVLTQGVAAKGATIVNGAVQTFSKQATGSSSKLHISGKRFATHRSHCQLICLHGI